MTERKRKRVPVGDDGQPIVASEETLPEDDQGDDEEVAEDCDCPRLDPEDWDGVESDWSDIAFLKGTSSAVLGVPTGFASTRDELVRKAEKLGATVPEDAMALLGSGQFRRPVLLEIEDAPQHKDVVRPGGHVYTRLAEAPMGVIKKAVQETEADAAERYGRKPDETWIWYLTCRHCSRPRNFEILVVGHYKDRG